MGSLHSGRQKPQGFPRHMLLQGFFALSCGLVSHLLHLLGGKGSSHDFHHTPVHASFS